MTDAIACSGHLGQKLAVDQPAGQVHAMSEAADGDVIRPSGRLTMQGAMPVTMKTAEQRPKPPMDKVGATFDSSHSSTVSMNECPVVRLMCQDTEKG